MHKTSKGCRRFSQRLSCFREDLEVADVFKKNIENIAGTNVIFKNVNSTHTELNKRQSSRGSRKLVVNHMLHTLNVSIIKEMYEEVMAYLSYVLKCGALTLDEPNRLVGDQSFSMQANEILRTTSREEIVRIVMENIFRKLENKRDTLLLIREINARLGLSIGEDVIGKAMPYLEARHKFVHADGIVDEQFKASYPAIRIDGKGRIVLDKTEMSNAMSSIKNLVNAFEHKMKELNYFLPEEFE